MTGSTVTSKTYDASNTAQITGGSLVGVIASDSANVSLSQAGSFISVNVGSGIVVTATDSLGGTADGNYSLTQPTGLTGSITKAPLGITVTATYNATSSVSPSAFTSTGLVNGETITNLSNATLSSALVSANGTNYVSAITISGGTASMSNYSLSTAYNASAGTSQNTATLNIVSAAPILLESLAGLIQVSIPDVKQELTTSLLHEKLEDDPVAVLRGVKIKCNSQSSNDCI